MKKRSLPALHLKCARQWLLDQEILSTTFLILDFKSYSEGDINNPE